MEKQSVEYFQGNTKIRIIRPDITDEERTERLREFKKIALKILTNAAIREREKEEQQT